ncbi:MHYT domain-containing protein [Lentzea sp.]|uniref:MHYT domain-containing protein n=1 Tax=Lentzea sp. TaxID=56099 RepID=UPI002CC243AC|nr:MHYT domain-containing protein [Lentzea sp.]HUQ60143.1 MHYT domain-containing protein [Lentzea sp.]
MEMGTASPIAAYVVACLGSALGLLSSERARNAIDGSREWWLAVAAVSIGGLGIWGMHFTAMLGTWMGATVGYDIPITLLSMIVAIAVVGIGLFLVLRLDNDAHDRWWPLLAGGLVTGIGVAAMHYTGMQAMSITLGQGAPIVVDNSEDLITSLIIGGAGFSVIIIFLLALTTSDDEQREEAELLDRVMRRADHR